MRILALVGWSLPVLAVPALAMSGAVAQALNLQISATLRAPANMSQTVADGLPSQSVPVRAGQLSPALPEAAKTFIAPPHPGLALPVGTLGGSGFAPERISATELPVTLPAGVISLTNVKVVSEPVVRPRPRIKLPRKNIRSRHGVGPSGPAHPHGDGAESAAAKPVFKMPWQTGIFQ